MKQRRNSTGYFFLTILVSLFVKLWIFDFIHVSGPSMNPTLAHGTFAFEFKLAWGIPVPFMNAYLVRWAKPRPGDIVIYPWLDRYVVKRCAAIEGSPLVFSADNGYSVLTGGRSVPLTEAQYQKLKSAKEVPEGMIFALGDNMAESRDSREYGFVSLDSIRGKILWK